MKRHTYLLSLILAFGLGIAFTRAIPALKPESPKKVTGIGGIFFKCKDPKKMREWYAKNLGLQMSQYGAIFEWRRGADSSKKGFTQWAPFKETTTYFAPGKADFMINYRVENLEALVKQLRSDGVTITDTLATYDYGKFVHILDAENNTVELWQPNVIERDQAPGSTTK
jgi:predicted enzyme related to lactoylglutathione lyase